MDFDYPKSEQDFGIARWSVAIMLEAALESRYKYHRNLCFEQPGKPSAPFFDEAL
jgi:hypothetical protein